MTPLRLLACLPALLLAAIAAEPAAPAPAKQERPPETTPTEFPGAETFVYRDDPATGPMRLFVMKPAGWQTGDRRGAIIFFFGGGWTTGTPRNSIGWAKTAAGLGLVGIAPDYRTNGRYGTTPLQSVADSRAALRWVQDHAAELGLDPARIVVGGSSAGGHVALWTAITATPPGSNPAEAPQTKPAALILYSAVSDTSLLRGYTPRRFGEHAEALSPLHQLDERMPPTLMFHGDADATVPYAQAVALHAKLTGSGNVSEFVTVPGGSHNIASPDPSWRERSRDLVIDFLRRHGVIDPAK